MFACNCIKNFGLRPLCREQYEYFSFWADFTEVFSVARNTMESVSKGATIATIQSESPPIWKQWYNVTITILLKIEANHERNDPDFAGNL
jgi:hypothetical protein